MSDTSKLARELLARTRMQHSMDIGEAYRLLTDMAEEVEASQENFDKLREVFVTECESLRAKFVSLEEEFDRAEAVARQKLESLAHDHAAAVARAEEAEAKMELLKPLRDALRKYLLVGAKLSNDYEFQVTLAIKAGELRALFDDKDDVWIPECHR